jgi:hypothetical protein
VSQTTRFREVEVSGKDRRRSSALVRRIAAKTSMVAVAAILAAAPRPAAAQAVLVGASGGELPPSGTTVTPSTPVTAGPRRLVVPPEARVVDTISAVTAARERVGAALARKQKAVAAVRQAVVSGGDVGAAKSELAAAEAELVAAIEGVRTAAKANEAETKRLVTEREKELYGPDGPSTLQRFGVGARVFGGVLVGTGAGTVVGVGQTFSGTLHVLAHPVESVRSLAKAFSTPLPTQEERLERSTAELVREREQRLAQTNAPFETSYEGGYIIGTDVVGPLAGGELLGAAGTLAGRAGRAVTVGRSGARGEGAAAPVLVEPTPTPVGGQAAEVKVRLEPLYAKAELAKTEIDLLSDSVAAEEGGTVAKAPLKSRESALRKVVTEYGGDVSRLKDLARDTIVIDHGKEIETLALLRKHDPEILEGGVKIVDPAKDPLGYSGITVSVPTKSGLTAEVQINSPEMIYAKEAPADARRILGDARYEQLLSTPGIPPGGRGHALYEQWRVMPEGPAKDLVAAESRAYYASVRLIARGGRP